ncbi:MAG: hypothetical protein IIZ23_00465 [Ruminococcus sp.]|nr:hypothetical protein [Ruminococcus sp.]
MFNGSFDFFTADAGVPPIDDFPSFDGGEATGVFLSIMLFAVPLILVSVAVTVVLIILHNKKKKSSPLQENVMQQADYTMRSDYYER